MAIDISIELAGGERLHRRLEGISVKLDNLQPFFKRAIDILKDKVDDTFKTQGKRLIEGSWAVLAPSTVKARSKRRGYYAKNPDNPSTLRWTGRLQDDVVKKSFRNKGQLIFVAPYAMYHHLGHGPMHRKLVELDPRTGAEIVRALQVFINNEHGIANIRI